MYKVEKYYTFKTLLKQENRQQQISRMLGIHRDTAKKIKFLVVSTQTELPPI